MTKLNLSLVIGFTLAASAAVGCAHAPQTPQATCEQADWYEVGRRDGAQGLPPERFSEHQKECAKKQTSDWETMYTNGRNAALVEFCEPKNGYELGKAGATYFYVCPSTIEPQFLVSFRKGQAARDLESQNEKLDEQITQLSQKLMQANNSGEQRDLEEQLAQLKTSRARNDRALNRINERSSL